MLAWLHDLSPFLLRISGEFGLRWYGLSYALGFVIAFVILRWLGKRGATLIPPERAGDAIMILVIGAVVGGRLGYVLFYAPSMLWTFSPSFPWWHVLAVNDGGMASHGGMIGVFLACCYLTRGFVAPDGTRVGKMPLLHMLDVTGFLATPGLMLGRLANFVNGELLGKIVAMPGEPAPWWAVKFPQEFLEGHDASAQMTPEAAEERTRAIAAIVRSAGYDGDLATGYRRVLEKIQGGNTELANALVPWISARHPSQLYQAAAEGLVIGAALWIFWRVPRTPGFVAAIFLIGYGVLRIVTEFYRLPDAQLAVQRIAGLSRGQWLSVGMIVCGTVVAVIAKSQKNEKLGGWGRARTVA